MLNGLAPLIIFQIGVPLPPTPADLVGPPGPTSLLDDLLGAIGIPIPIYLDEKLTGIYVDTETRAVDIETNAQQLRTGEVVTDQRGLNSLVTVNMFANKDSIPLTVLLALSDMIFSQVVSKSYRVSYFNGPTVIIGGLLHGFQTAADSNDDLIRITLQISKANQASTVQNIISVLPKITGAVPIAG